jgi:DNA-binding beta-propeller fold protein YncE
MSKSIWLAIVLAGCTTHGGSGSGSSDAGSGAPPFTKGVSTLAGAADPGFVDGSRDVARFSNPVGVAFGPDGNLYVADFDNGKLRVVDSSGTTSTLIAQSGFRRPFNLAFAKDGTLWVTTDDDKNGTHVPMQSGSVWRVDVHAKVATLVANAIGMPRGIAPLADGRVALADYENHIIELLDPATGKVTVIAGARGVAGYADGAGAVARFSSPYGMIQRADGKLVVADWGNNRLRVIGLDGTTTTFAGTGDAGFTEGALLAAQFSHPEAIAQDQNGNLYVTDTMNFRVRRVANGSVDTIAGDGTAGYIDADDRLGAELYGLEGATVRPDGSMVYVGDGNRGDSVPYNRVRQIDMASAGS